jgi:hypothetical protein
LNLPRLSELGGVEFALGRAQGNGQLQLTISVLQPVAVENVCQISGTKDRTGHRRKFSGML